jgi:SAM-dependent MidA family methyltransferase
MSEPRSLETELRRIIESEGPISVARYMALCLSHPHHGYYMRRDPFGAAGDFVTAPEISQMFGELIGLWAAAVWAQMGAPAGTLLVELGPGRGTLMADALRAAKAASGFCAALSVHLVEISPALRLRQQEALAPARAEGISIHWHQDIAAIPEAPMIVIANEFFDALPIEQVVKQADGWHLRAVGLDAENGLAFGLQPIPIPRFEATLPAPLRDAAPGAVYAWRSDAVIAELGRRLAHFGGAALIIDYGYTESGFGDTLQAVRGHAFDGPLAHPGDADLTAHVDFAALGRATAHAGSRVHGPVPQGDFLRRLGIKTRATKLKSAANATQIASIDAALARLTGDGESNMGTLFKAMAASAPALISLPGFDS